MLTVFVGNNDIELSKVAKQHAESAYLINSKNYADEHVGICYTSLADLPGLAEFTSILRQADTIIYHPSKEWSSDSLQSLTEYFINVFSFDKEKKVIKPNLFLANDQDKILELNAKRINADQALWVSGCSISIGACVKIEERFANLLAQDLNLPLYMLGHDGASNLYAADQILRSDIRKDDIVIFGITSENRLPFYSNTSSLLHINARSYPYHSEFNKIVDLDFLDSKTLIYSSVVSIYQVVNFCKKIGAKLVLAGLLTSPTLASYFVDLEEYIHLYHYHGFGFIDVGDDNLHPGPETHKWYTKKILEKLKVTNE